MKKTLYLIVACMVLAATGRAQKEHTSNKKFAVDSIIICLGHWQAQNAAQDTLVYAKQYVWQYFCVEKDTLYAVLPVRYHCYEPDNVFTGRREINKVMVTVEKGTVKTYLRVYDLVGRKVAICSTKDTAVVYLDL